MKKILFASTALVASAAFGTAFAADKPVGTIGGYMFMGAGLSDNNTSGDTEVGILRDGEIHLGWRGTSDNGLTFTGRIELEAFTDGRDQIDENWGQVSGAFGSLLIGSNDTAGDNFGDVGILYGPGARLAYYDGFGTVPTSFSDDAGDALGIRYATPTIAGFTAAASYHPNGGTDGVNDTGYGFASRGPGIGPKDVYSLAANYKGEFSGVGIAFGGDYTAADDTARREVWSLGTEISASGFKVGFHYEDNIAVDSQDYAIGVGYSTGPWGVAGGYSLSEIAGAPDIDSFGGWVTYALSPGVTVAGGVEYGEQGKTEAYNAMTYLAINF